MIFNISSGFSTMVSTIEYITTESPSTEHNLLANMFEYLWIFMIILSIMFGILLIFIIKRRCCIKKDNQTNPIGIYRSIEPIYVNGNNDDDHLYHELDRRRNRENGVINNEMYSINTINRVITNEAYIGLDENIERIAINTTYENTPQNNTDINKNIYDFPCLV